MTEDEEFEALEQRLNMKEQEYEQINHPNGVTTWKTKPKHKEQAMNREDIIRMAREADLICENRPVTAWMESTDLTPYLTRFAALVDAAAVERERDKQQEALKLALGELQAGKVGNAMQILREALAEQPAQQRPQNCGTGYCSCIECPYEQQESKQ